MRSGIGWLTLLVVGCMPAPGPAQLTGPDGAAVQQAEGRVAALDRSAFKPGERLTIFGQGFDPSPAGNRVEFVGGEATPELATAESMRVAVPLGIRSGALRVLVRGNTAGVLSYVVDPPEVATLSHGAASLGHQITLRGRHFAPVLGENRVAFNGTEVLPLAGGNGVLVVVVQGSSGPLTVRTGAGSSDPLPFVVIPQLGGSFNP